MSQGKQVLVQVTGSAEDATATDNFNRTVMDRVDYDLIRQHVGGAVMDQLETRTETKISVWGSVPKNGEGPKFWRDLRSGDFVLFYSDKRYFHRATVFTKVHSKALAQALWPADDDGRYFEYIYFVTDDAKLNAPFDQTVMDYGRDHMRNSVLFRRDKATALIEYINQFDQYVIDVESIEPVERDAQKLEKEIKKCDPKIPVSELLEHFSDLLESATPRERVVQAKLLVRNQKVARAVKERDNYICQICGAPPFIKKDGLPYAEAHHVLELAEHRIDHESVMITVCPTCHRILHYGNDAALKEQQSLKR